jgi:hypothetical protein
LWNESNSTSVPFNWSRCAVGVHEIVFPLIVAPVGALVKEKATAVPVAAT